MHSIPRSHFLSHNLLLCDLLCDSYISRENLRDLLGRGSSETFIDKLMEEADIKKDGRISYEEFLHVLSAEHRRNLTKIYKEAEGLSAVSTEEAETLRETNEVLRRHGLLGSLKSSMNSFGNISFEKKAK